jgi:hypothetical protein
MRKRVPATLGFLDLFGIALERLCRWLWRRLKRRLPTWRAFFYWRLARRIPERARRKHTYISGSSGSGKTELLKIIVYGLVRKPRFCTTIVLDPNGDMASQIARWKENSSGERCVVIDLSLHAGFSPVINPLQVSDRSPENIDLMAQLFVSAFNEIMDDSKLTLNMKVLLHPCVSVLMELGDASFPDLQCLLDEERNADLLLRVQASRTYREYRDFFEYEFHHSDYRPTKRAIEKKIQSLLNYQTFHNLTVGKSTVDLRALMDSRKLVIFNLSKGKLGVEAMPAFGKFLVAMLQGLALRREAMPEFARVPTHLIIDECHNFITPAVEEILKESRKYALHLTLAQQTIGDKMSSELLNTVMTNTEVKITGFNDKKCLDTMAAKTYTDPPLLYRLSTGRFAVKVGKGVYPPTFVLHCPRFLLGSANAMPPAAWQELTDRQLEAYYTPVKSWGTRPPVTAVTGTAPEELAATDPPPRFFFQRKRPRLPKVPKYQF